MNDELLAAVDEARKAGFGGLVCRTCNGEGQSNFVREGWATSFACPACNGTGYPSAAEVLMWALVRRTSEKWGATPEEMAEEMLRSVIKPPKRRTGDAW